MIPMPAALLFTAKPGTGLTFKSDTFRLLSTLEQALTDENEDGRREDGRTTINMIPVPAALLFSAKPRCRPNFKSGIFRLLSTLEHRD